MNNPTNTVKMIQEIIDSKGPHVSTALGAFIDEVNRRAEKKMMKTGKLEGSHKASLDEVWKEINQ